MRSVVVVLHASICAMIPMLRTLSRAFVATVASSSSQLQKGGVLLARVVRVQHQYSAEQGCDIPARRCSGLPAIVREGLVRLGHLVRVLAPLDGGTEAVARVEQLVHEALGHRLLATGPAVLDQPAETERGAARRANLDRDLVGRTTDAAAA